MKSPNSVGRPRRPISAISAYAAAQDRTIFERLRKLWVAGRRPVASRLTCLSTSPSEPIRASSEKIENSPRASDWPQQQALQREVDAWQDHRNKHHAKADWQFTTNDARVKLKRLYPHFD